MIPVLVGVTLILVLEILLRLASPPMAEEIFEFDPDLGYCPAADRQIQAATGVFLPEGCDRSGPRHTITTDGAGERVVPASRPDQPFTLAVLGDSCSFGWDVSDDETFANRLAERADEAAAGLSVRLLAVPGYSSLEGYLYYQQRVAPPPDIAVIAYGANDEDPVDASPWRGGLTDHELHGFVDGQAGEVPAAVRWRMTLGRSPLLSLVYRLRPGEGGDARLRLTPRQTREALDRMVGQLRSQGVAVIVHNLCSSSRAGEVREVALDHDVAFVDTDSAMRRQWRRSFSDGEIARIEREAADRLGAECVDAHPELLVTTDDFHPNVHGSRVVADALWPEVAAAVSALGSSAAIGAP